MVDSFCEKVKCAMVLKGSEEHGHEKERGQETT